VAEQKLDGPPMDGPSMDGRVAWITGGANGFGAGVARRLASLGAKVVVSDLDRENGEKVAADIGGSFVTCDVSSYEDNAAAVAAVLDEHGRLDIAFLNAGVATGIGIGDDFDLDRYRRAMAINLDGVAFGLHHAVGAMSERGGDVVATASLAGLVATPFDPIYGANKHAVVGLVRAAGAAYGPQGIRVNALCPGFADTNIVSKEAREGLARRPAARSRTCRGRIHRGDQQRGVRPVLVHPTRTRKRAVPVPQRPRAA
jgi:NAD(P)-dependent dehydrogenase (short-subunit alcohol dehydrogenase family)